MDESPRIVVGIVEKWPYHWSDWRWFVRHPYRGYRVVRLFVLWKLYLWVKP